MYTKEEAYIQIAQLTERFEEQIASYKKSDYNETLTRRDFIDPFFKALGWDMDNSQGYAEAYREVIHEDKLKVGAATKAPDYSFRLPGGKRLFFVEAKKPSIRVKDEILPAYQVRRYGWSAKLPISLITDFEELAVYDCTKKPAPGDKASAGRIKYLTYKNYLDEFDFIWGTFSKGSVLKGSFDKFIAADTHKKGTATVDKEFLQSLDQWRMLLAANIAQRNQQLTEDELNFVVQQTIDRIIFLRIAEDRKVEAYGQLQSIVKTYQPEGEFYKSLYRQFTEADSKYNSGLFDFKRDKLSSQLIIDNKVLKNIINELYYPLCPYEFSVLGVEILGSAYEQFLGKQIKLDSRHRAVIEEKPEVRKAGGVYYTPQYIVDYIVENTIGKLAPLHAPKEGKTVTPEMVAKITVCDPACGSGSFLLGAYDYLLKWHLEYYKPEFTRLTEIAGDSKQYNNKQRNDAIKERNKLPLTPEGTLSTALKKQILINNIYGVDLDTQAVEVTKLSLLLKCMEGETASSINAEMRFGERVLPTLDNNIKCGNSLIDVDYYDAEFFDLESERNPFSWERSFPSVFSNSKYPVQSEIRRHNQELLKQFAEAEKRANELIGMIHNKVEEPEIRYGFTKGFDVIIGNPPYGALFSESEMTYLKKRYHSSTWRGESYLLFVEKSLTLLKKDGQLGLIIPDTLLNLGFTEHLREYILRNSKIEEIVSLPSKVFAGATVDTILLFTEKRDRVLHFHPGKIRVKTFDKKSVIHKVEQPFKFFTVATKEWFEQKAFNVRANDSEKKLLDKLDAQKISVENIAEMFSGIKVYEIGKGVPPQTEEIRNTKPYTSHQKQSKEWTPFFDGKHIGAYQLFWNNDNWIQYGKWLAAPRQPENFAGEKILIRKITGSRLIATYVPDTSYCNTLLFVLKLTNTGYTYKSILAILNSQLMGWYFRTKFQISNDDTFPQIMIRDILQFPIPAIGRQADKELNEFVNDMLSLNKQKQTTTLPEKLEQLNQRIAYTDDKINKLVYELYGLTEEEVAIVEGL